MRHSLYCLLAASVFAAGCSSLNQTVQYQQAASVTNRLDDHAFVLQHTAAGSYTYDAVSSDSGKVTLNVAGVINHDDQDAIVKVLEGHRYDKERPWNEIVVLFYAKTAATPQGVAYVTLLRQVKIEP
jgi:hypothetical protein